MFLIATFNDSHTKDGNYNYKNTSKYTIQFNVFTISFFYYFYTQIESII